MRGDVLSLREREYIQAARALGFGRWRIIMRHLIPNVLAPVIVTATLGIGKKWECHCWKPTLWAYYDWAEGNDDRGEAKGFNHLFPLAHKYLGYMDLFGRSNIESFNVQLTLQPHEKVKLIAWYYYLFLENKNDSPYNVNMSPFNGDNDPGSADLGQELDLLLSYSLSPRMELALGYSHFFAGRYYDTTADVPYDGDANFAYVQYVWNF